MTLCCLLSNDPSFLGCKYLALLFSLQCGQGSSAGAHAETQQVIGTLSSFVHTCSCCCASMLVISVQGLGSCPLVPRFMPEVNDMQSPCIGRSRWCYVPSMAMSPLGSTSRPRPLTPPGWRRPNCRAGLLACHLSKPGVSFLDYCCLVILHSYQP